MQERPGVPEVHVASQADFEGGECKIIVKDDLEIGVFFIGGRFYAYENDCPHLGGPVCQGRLFPKVEEILAEDKTSRGLRFSEQKIHIVCPWHGYEFDIQTGVHPADNRIRLRKFEVKVRAGEVYVVV